MAEYYVEFLRSKLPVIKQLGAFLSITDGFP
jgi:hypothetical protein